MSLSAQPRSALRVVIADDHSLFRDALRLVLETDRNIAVVGQAADGDQALKQVESLHPVVLLLDINMPRCSGLDVLERLGPGSSARTILLTGGITRSEIVTALKLGARGILLKDSSSATLLECVHAVASGAYWVRGEQVTELLQAAAVPSPAVLTPIQTLTPRELQIIAQVMEGASNRDIGLTLKLSEQTVKNHLSHIFDKLGVSNRLELALQATHHRLRDATHTGRPAPAQ